MHVLLPKLPFVLLSHAPCDLWDQQCLCMSSALVYSCSMLWTVVAVMLVSVTLMCVIWQQLQAAKSAEMQIHHFAGMQPGLSSADQWHDGP
jgi:hypothetical protein